MGSVSLGASSSPGTVTKSSWSPPGNIIVTSGTRLTLTGSILFRDGATIFVERGGELVLDRATLEPAPGCSPWKGIYMNHDGNFPQNKADQSSIIIKNSFVNKSQHGIYDRSRLGSGGSSWKPGPGPFLDIQNSQFYENGQVLHLQGNGKSTKRIFKNNRIIVVNNATCLTPTIDAMIDLTDMMNYEINNNYFENPTTVRVKNIELNNTSAQVNENTSKNALIFLENFGGMPIVTWAKCNTIDNATFGIESHNSYFTMTDNTFNNSAALSTQGYKPQRFQARMYNSTDFTISNNIFNSDGLINTTLPNLLGLITENVTTANNVVNYNTFNRFGQYATVNIGVNAQTRSTETVKDKSGLYYVCNTLRNATDKEMFNFSRGAIREAQATYDVGNQVGAADNSFTNLSGVPTKFNLLNNGVAYRYYFQGINNSSNNRYPFLVSPNVTRINTNNRVCGVGFSKTNVSPINMKQLYLGNCAIKHAPAPDIKLLTDYKPILVGNHGIEVVKLIGINDNIKLLGGMAPPELIEERNAQQDLVSVIKGDLDLITAIQIEDKLVSLAEGEEVDETALVGLFKEYKNYHGYVQLADYYTWRKNYPMSLTTLHEAEQLDNLEEDEALDLVWMKRYYQLRAQLGISGRLETAMSEEEIQEMKTIAQAETIGASTRARDFLSAYYDMDWQMLTSIDRSLCDPAPTDELIAKGAGKKEFAFRFYPNPFQQSAMLEFKRPVHTEKLEIEFMNQLGQVVYHTGLSLTQDKHDLSLKNLPNGLYLLTIKVNGQRYTSTTVHKE